MIARISRGTKEELRKRLIFAGFVDNKNLDKIIEIALMRHTTPLRVGDSIDKEYTNEKIRPNL